MTNWAHWRGLIARTGTDTNDGRRLLLEDFAASHFVRLPVPVTARPTPTRTTVSGVLEETQLQPFVVVGRIDRVSIREPKTLQHHGKEIRGEGVVNLDDLFQVRPDLRETVFTTGDNGESTHTAWPVGIEVIGGDFEGDPNAGSVIVSGRWELAAMAIEHTDSVWPGVGIECYRFEDDGLIRA